MATETKKERRCEREKKKQEVGVHRSDFTPAEDPRVRVYRPRKFTEPAGESQSELVQTKTVQTTLRHQLGPPGLMQVGQVRKNR